MQFQLVCEREEHGQAQQQQHLASCGRMSTTARRSVPACSLASSNTQVFAPRTSSSRVAAGPNSFIGARLREWRS